MGYQQTFPDAVDARSKVPFEARSRPNMWLIAARIFCARAYVAQGVERSLTCCLQILGQVHQHLQQRKAQLRGMPTYAQITNLSIIRMVNPCGHFAWMSPELTRQSTAVADDTSLISKQKSVNCFQYLRNTQSDKDERGNTTTNLAYSSSVL